jgi:hypothetical protein
MAKPPTENPTQKRHDIDAGHMADKTPGFDPAAAPMETDAEAGGAASPSGSAAEPKGQQRFVNAASYANAMRPTGTEAPVGRKYGPVFVAIAVIVILAAGAIIIATMA